MATERADSSRHGLTFGTPQGGLAPTSRFISASPGSSPQARAGRSARGASPRGAALLKRSPPFTSLPPGAARQTVTGFRRPGRGPTWRPAAATAAAVCPSVALQGHGPRPSGAPHASGTSPCPATPACHCPAGTAETGRPPCSLRGKLRPRVWSLKAGKLGWGGGRGSEGPPAPLGEGRSKGGTGEGIRAPT